MTLQEEARALVVDYVADLGQTFDDDVLDAVFLGVTDAEFLAAAGARVRWRWWDEQEPINGVPAERVRERFTVTGPAYLVYVDDQLAYFQPHVPQAPGLTSLDSTSDEVVAIFVDSLVRGLARDLLVVYVVAALQQVATQQQERAAEVEAGISSGAATAFGRRRPFTAKG